MLKIIQVPHKVLTTPTGEIKKIDDKIRKLVYDMEETLVAQVDPQGVGLAAPQVGVNLSLFIMKPSLKAETEVCINPHILKIEDRKSRMDENKKLEGCLSIPRIWGPVKRPQKVLLEYQDLTGEKHLRWFTGFKATIVQHEVDHLQGVLFTRRALEQKTVLYEEKNGELEKMKY
jgi:peptide deformylase